MQPGYESNLHQPNRIRAKIDPYSQRILYIVQTYAEHPLKDRSSTSQGRYVNNSYLESAPSYTAVSFPHIKYWNVALLRTRDVTTIVLSQ